MKVRATALGVAVAAVSLLATSAVEASAAVQPTKEPFHASATFTDTSICGFPIQVTIHASGFNISFFNDAGD